MFDEDNKPDIDFMRADLECNMGYSKIIEATKRRFEEEGRNFESEFKKWKESGNQ